MKKTQYISIDLSKTPVQRSQKFEIMGKHNRYYKRFWDETRGDEYADWGKSWWYFETDANGVILRQIEEYENGIVQFYPNMRTENTFGGLGKTPLPFEEFQEYCIFQEDFEAIWNANTQFQSTDFYKYIKAMKHRTGLYLGEYTISAMYHHLSGYDMACYHHNLQSSENLTPRWGLFHEFTKRKTGFSESTGGWKYMILEHCKGDEAKALDLFFAFFDEFLTNAELKAHVKTLVPKNKFDMNFDKVLDFHWYNYTELKPIIPELLTWLQDPNWPVAKPISVHLTTMLPDIIDDLVPILESEDGIWKYNILNYFFVKTKTEHYLKIKDLLEKLAFQASENDKKEEVDVLVKAILNRTF
jgi:hypothetical protein